MHTMESDRAVVTVLDYGGGNIRSLSNAIRRLGFEIKFVETAADIAGARKLVFPGVGSFGAAMQFLHDKGYTGPLREYIRAGRPFFGICIGMQTLFEGSEEAPGVEGLGVFRGQVTRFDPTPTCPVPHIGWNGVHTCRDSLLFGSDCADRYYFVHSFRVRLDATTAPGALCVTDYGEQRFVSAVAQGRTVATQFHPEKSGERGLALIRRFLEAADNDRLCDTEAAPRLDHPGRTSLAHRVIACLDVRSNDTGDLVVTKGDQYDVREGGGEGGVRNMGKPVELSRSYYDGGADEIAYLNITSFRELPLSDTPMLTLIERASEVVFVPLTIGGGIRDYTDLNGQAYTALEVASRYFHAGADKVSIGGDAVLAAEALIARGGAADGTTAIETISRVYGKQAVVISVDPRRVYVSGPEAAPGKHVISTSRVGPNGEAFCWYQCTVRGGREARDLDAWAMCRACEALGAGEILLNCIDQDGTNSGFDIELVADIKAAVSIPVIASSGAGCKEHFEEVFVQAKPDAALAAGIFHRKEVLIQDVKTHLESRGLPTRSV